MNNINPPSAAKTIFAYVANFILFIIYYYALCFIGGMFVGVYEEITKTSVADDLVSMIVLVALGVNVLLTIFLRKKIYFHTARPANVVAEVSAPIVSESVIPVAPMPTSTAADMENHENHTV